MGEHRIITRAQVHATLQSSPAGEHSAHSMHGMAALVQAKAEYHGNKASDAEELTPEELVRWWSAAHVRPGAHVVVCTPRLYQCPPFAAELPTLAFLPIHWASWNTLSVTFALWNPEKFPHMEAESWSVVPLQVGHVGVHSCQLLQCQHFTAGELLEAAAGAGFRPGMMWRLMSALLGQLTGLPCGQYLLTHQPGAEAICLFAADCEEVQQSAEVCPGAISSTGLVPVKSDSPCSRSLGLLLKCMDLQRGCDCFEGSSKEALS